MSDNIVFPCPACGTKYSVAPQNAGRRTKCKKCSATITVPSPEVANPTLIGTTRTIRRADIPASASTREKPQRAKPPTGQQPRKRRTTKIVDMTGGAGVLRKDATVSQRQHQRAPSRRSPAVPQPGRPPSSRNRAAQRQTHPGRPAQQHPGAYPGMPPGMYPPQKKKNNAPLIIGLAGGGGALVLVVVLVIALSSGGSGTVPPPPQQDDVVQVDPAQQQRNRLLGQMQNALGNISLLGFSQIQQFYNSAKEHNEFPEFKQMQDNWAEHMIRSVEDQGDAEVYARVALMLDDDGYGVARDMIRDAAVKLVEADKMVNRIQRDDGRHGTQITPLFREITERAGWEPYQWPEEMSDWVKLAIEGTSEFNEFYVSPEVRRFDMVEMFPPDIVEGLRKLESVARENAEALYALHEEDQFAINARLAYVRFKNTNAGGADWDRTRGQRVFSPDAMGRAHEDFDDIWTYTYWRPFIVFVEKPEGDWVSEEELLETLAARSALLRQLWDWFDDHFIQPMELERVLPMGQGPVRGRDETVYDTPGKRAEAEGWPMEVIVMQDEISFRQLMSDERGGEEPPPGVRAYYSPVQERVVTWDDRESVDPDTVWFNDSVMIHEVFHLLSDHYAAKPLDWNSIMRETPIRQPRPRYSNLFVQEGITDSVAGYVREGTGADSQYEFLRLNHLRLRSWQFAHREIFDNRNFFRIQDLLEPQRYPDLVQVGAKRFLELGMAQNEAHAFFMGRRNHGMLMGMYYAAACKTSYFFHTYEENGRHPYRDKWWEYLKRDYTGTLGITGWNPTPGIRAFAEIFDLETEDDWERLNKKLEDYLLSLTPDDVGSGHELESDIEAEPAPDNQDSVRPWRRAYPFGSGAGEDNARAEEHELEPAAAD